jgi:excinuclease UvrABC nuclease subunit
MISYQAILNDLIQKLKQNIELLMATQEVPLSKVELPKSPGVYMIFFEGKLQYIGSSGNLNHRIKTTLLSGDRKSHTLINKLCELRNWDLAKTRSFLKSSSNIKFVVTKTEDDAKILEDVLIAIYHPFYIFTVFSRYYPTTS